MPTESTLQFLHQLCGLGLLITSAGMLCFGGVHLSPITPKVIDLSEIFYVGRVHLFFLIFYLGRAIIFWERSRSFSIY